MQTSEMDRKREAFLEHLKQKYPHHATAIMGHQERLRDQTKSPKLSHSPQPPSLGDPVEHLSETSGDSLEAMSEGDVPSPFTRGSRTRASLPVVRSTNQTKERSLGVLYLQYGDETKQLRMPNEITSADTIRALFVSAFPQQLTMKMLESPSVAIYIKDESRNVYYELNDVRNIQDRSLLKVYNKDPSHAFNHMAKAVNGDVRMQREIVYARGDGLVAPRPGSTAHPPHAIPNSPPSTPGPHSLPPSPSRIPYGGSRPMAIPGNATIPRDRLSSLPVSRSISPSPSAILERRDVKPDEDMSNKNLVMFRNEGFYADPYLYHEGRMSIASSHGGHPLDVPDHVIAYHRTAIRSASAYCNPSLQAEMHMEQSLYRQKSRKYPDSHLPTLGSKTPPASPHRVGDLRMIDMHPHLNAHGPPHTLQPDRVSPSRQSFKKEPGTLVYIEKPRNAPGLSSLVDLGPPLVEKQVFAYSTATIPKDRETRERMQAMEKQIASLTGLVQSALSKGPITSSSKEASSEKMTKATANRNQTDGAGKGLGTLESPLPPSQPLPAGTSAMHMSLLDMRRNVAELRLQLQQMRQLQLQNQEILRAMMKKAELEISSKVKETMKRLEDPVQRQRTLVEQDRQKYLHEEERIVKKLRELEDFVEDLKKDSSSAGRVVTLKDVEDGAFLLRQVGEAVATLKGEFPTLQNKMRAVLRIEVEAVRFLKEEPHKLDSLLKRVRSMTDVLTMLRRHVTDGLLKGTDAAQAAQYVAMEKATAAEVLKHQEETVHMPGQPLHSSTGGPGDVKSEVVPLSTMTVHHVQSSPVVMQPSQHSSALLNPAQNLPGGTGSHTASPTAVTQEVTSAPQSAPAPQSPQTPMNGSSMQSLFIEEIHSVSAKNRAVSIEKAERKWEEKRQNLEHYNGKEFEKLLEEAQANIMKSIPNLEMPPASGPVPKAEATVDKLESSEDSPNSEQELDKLGGKSPPPPPPPPRRSYLPGSGLTTTRSGDVIYTGRKENMSKVSSEDSGPTPQTRATKCPTEEPASAWAPSPPPVPTSSSKDEEEEEGDKIMAELQAFQKCSFTDVNPNSHAEQSRADPKDSRPGATAPPKEKKNLEFFHEDVRKSDVECENGPQVESQKVTTGALRPSGPPMWERAMVTSMPDTARTPECRADTFMEENSTPNKNMFRDSRNYSQKNVPKVNFNFTGMNSLEGEINKGPKVSGLQRAIPDSENQKLNSGKTRETGQQGQENTDKSHIPPPTRSAELSIHDAKTQDHDALMTDLGQVVLRSKVGRHTNMNTNGDGESTPSSPSEEHTATDNIAFMITKTAVQVLSSGEVHDIVSQKGEDVQTVNIDARKETTSQQEGTDGEEPVVCLDKKPVIIIFDEPMDIRSAYKRLSTIFEECDEELERMMTEEKIEEEEEEDENGDTGVQTSPQMSLKQVDSGSGSRGQKAETQCQPQPLFAETQTLGGQEVHKAEQRKLSSGESPNWGNKYDMTDDQFESPKKKFKFKFPKKQLAALTQAIRTGTKTGKKTLQVVVYEEEEEDGTLKQHKEAKRFEITRSQPEDAPKTMARRQEQRSLEGTAPISRTDEIRKSTYRTLDSLEQTIKQLENTISEMSPRALVDTPCSSNRDCGASLPHIAQEGSPRSLLVLDEVSPAPEPPTSISSASRKGSSTTPQTSRMPVPMSSKNRPGSLDKPSKQSKLQDPRQYRQANGSAKKAGGDCKPTSPSLPASKIPALSPSSGKSSSLPSASGDSSNLPSAPATKPSIASTSLSPQAGRSTHSTSLIPSVSNGSLKFQSPPHAGKVSFALQAQNGRAAPTSSSSSSPPSPASPTSLNQGARGIRTIHTPSLASYKAQNGSSSKATPSTAKETS